jgi:tetratricopeptide (TPR) repeat protein
MSNPTTGQTLTQQGLDVLRKGQVAQALELLAQATQANPQDFDAALGLGVALTKNQQLMMAVQWLNYATSLHPDSSAAWQHLGQAHIALQNYDEAKAALQKSVDLDPNNQTARLLLAQMVQAPSVAPVEQTADEKCPQCGTMNPKGYRLCTMCSAPSSKLQEQREAAAAPQKARAERKIDGELTDAQQQKIIAMTAMFCGVLMIAQAARILWAMKESAMVTKLILYNVVAQVAVPFVVALVVLSVYGAVEEGRSVFKSAVAVGLAVAVALQIDSLFIEPVFGIVIAFIPFGGLIVLATLIYAATMFALEKAAHTRLDLSYTVAAAITIPTIILLAVASIVIGVGVIMSSAQDDPDRIITGKTTQEKQAEKQMNELLEQMRRGEQPTAPQPMPSR